MTTTTTTATTTTAAKTMSNKTSQVIVACAKVLIRMYERRHRVIHIQLVYQLMYCPLHMYNCRCKIAVTKKTYEISYKAQSADRTETYR